MTQQMQKSEGFTLIELLFVLAILAVMTVFGISAWQQKVMMTRVDKTALQMQMIMQAAVAYDVQKGDWPSTTPGEDGMGTLISAGYLPKQLNKDIWIDPWGAPYTAQPYIGDDGQPNKANYEVTANIPPENFKNYTSIAKLIAGKLPVTKNAAKGQVVAIVNVPAGSAVTNLGDNQMIVGAEEVNVDTPDGVAKGVKIKNYSCPKGWTKDVVTAIRGFNVSRGANSPAGDNLELYSTNSTAKLDKQQGTIALNTERYFGLVGRDPKIPPLLHKGSVLAITTCTKTKNPKELTKNGDSDNFIF